MNLNILNYLCIPTTIEIKRINIEYIALGISMYLGFSEHSRFSSWVNLHRCTSFCELTRTKSTEVSD